MLTCKPDGGSVVKYAYYNEIDPHCAEWLRNLIREGLIAPGDVDERDIRDVAPSELVGYTQLHWFAGIGGWSRALRLAGWSDDRPCWTGSCPCQSFSAAGRRKGFADERHLWPHWFHLIRVCRPSVLFGEQVASKAALQWLDLVQDDLEGEGYAVGAADLCAAGVGAFHIRQRLWFVGHSPCDKQRRLPIPAMHREGEQTGGSSGLGYPRHEGLPGRQSQSGDDGAEQQALERAGGDVAPLAHPPNGQLPQPGRGPEGRNGNGADCPEHGGVADSSQQFKHRSGGTGERRGEEFTNGGSNFWADAEWLYCRDWKWRPVEARYVKISHGISPGMGLVRSKETQKGGEVNAPAKKTGSRKILPSLRETDDSQEIPRRGFGGESQFRPPDILRPEVYGCRDGGSNKESKPDSQSAAISEKGQAILRDMWEKGSPLCPPSRHEPDEQRPSKLADFVRLLPSTFALAQLCGDTRTKEVLLALLTTCNAERLMLCPPDALQEVWQSLGKKNQDRFRLCVNDWHKVGISPLAAGEFERVKRLRAYGNAIVPQIAAEFIKAVMVE